jgi:outer membrane protein assembly factor BamA
MAGDVRHWGENRVQSVVGLVDASINLDFYGIGENSELSEHPLTYNLDTLGGGLRGKYRFGKSFLWLGATYVLADMEARFDEAPPSAELQELEGDTHVGGLVPLLAYDSRDNLFTPTRGTYAEGSAGFFDEALGGDDSFQRVSLQILHYIPLPAKVTLGFQGKATFAFGDTPFYLLPYITLRGVPIFRYQGEDAADLEVEARWQFWKRFSLVGFAGAGMAWNDFEHVDDQVTAFAGGTGLRYEIARKYGLQVGADVAFGPEGAVLYIVFGSAWARP